MVIPTKRNGLNLISSAKGLSFCFAVYQFLNIKKLRLAKYAAISKIINKDKNSTKPKEFNQWPNFIISPFYKYAAPKTPAESPSLFFKIGVSTLSLKTLL